MTDSEIRNKIRFPTKEDLREFINSNDSGITLEEHLDGCRQLLKRFKKKGNYEYCAILRDYIQLKNGEN